ncbi:MAG: hypothetical protein ACYCSN_17700 [Acidobacteriaceae bacterium]
MRTNAPEQIEMSIMRVCLNAGGEWRDAATLAKPEILDAVATWQAVHDPVRDKPRRSGRGSKARMPQASLSDLQGVLLCCLFILQ